jgi:hypothetical protein
MTLAAAAAKKSVDLSLTESLFFPFQVPDHFLPVVEATLREFFVALREGKDTESSWKKQIYKVIARYDEPIPDYFKTQEFLKQLE